MLKEITCIKPITEDFNLKWDHVLYDAEKSLVKLLLHESQQVIAKIELDVTSELANLNIYDTVQKQRQVYIKHKSYEKVLERHRTNKWRKVKDQEKQKIMPVLDETLNSKNTKVLIHQESLGRVEESLSCYNIKCDKPLCNDNITSDKANSTIQVDVKHSTDNRHFRKNKNLSYAEVLREGKDINSPKIESTATEIPKITQDAGAIDFAAIRSALWRKIVALLNLIHFPQ